MTEYRGSTYVAPAAPTEADPAAGVLPPPVPTEVGGGEAAPAVDMSPGGMARRYLAMGEVMTKMGVALGIVEDPAAPARPKGKVLPYLPSQMPYAAVEMPDGTIISQDPEDRAPAPRRGEAPSDEHLEQKPYFDSLEAVRERAAAAALAAKRAKYKTRMEQVEQEGSRDVPPYLTQAPFGIRGPRKRFNHPVI